ncbi:hypothetical protein CYOC110262_12135 [Cytobacillus oceanisediminis]|uniref:Uncharacterized protein n=1 Tax=Cytobacillus oceanisediminis TaxID=665099 RepID=A0A562JJ09_9BACI|nr:hypothetical protein IQ19_03874 [Cytobacillus oceanisediminis]
MRKTGKQVGQQTEYEARFQAGYPAGYEVWQHPWQRLEVETFPLLVRGGPTIGVRWHPGNVQGTFNILGLFFNKGTRPAGLGLAPGQGSWLDRGMSDNEPDILQQNVPANVTSAPWFIDLRSPNKYWTFYVFNTGQGVLRITRAHPGRRID